MFGLTGLHALASARGDGLRPELLKLFSERENLRAHNVVELFPRPADNLVQAGPSPAPPPDVPIPGGVLLFYQPETIDSRAILAQKRRNI